MSSMICKNILYLTTFANQLQSPILIFKLRRKSNNVSVTCDAYPRAEGNIEGIFNVIKKSVLTAIGLTKMGRFRLTAH